MLNEEEIRADEREKLLQATRDIANTLGIDSIEVPALVVLLLDFSPSTDSDKDWVKQAWEMWKEEEK